jgi:hypothetical protein
MHTILSAPTSSVVSQPPFVCPPGLTSAIETKGKDKEGLTSACVEDLLGAETSILLVYNDYLAVSSRALPSVASAAVDGHSYRS